MKEVSLAVRRKEDEGVESSLKENDGKRRRLKGGGSEMKKLGLGLQIVGSG